jgi:hypothetical protein
MSDPYLMNPRPRTLWWQWGRPLCMMAWWLTLGAVYRVERALGAP